MLTIDYKRAVALRPSGPNLIAFLEGIEGRKHWKGDKLSFPPTNYNVRLYREMFPDAPVDDQRALPSNTELADALGAPVLEEVATAFVVEPWDFQRRVFEKFKDMPVFALFGDPGTGKSKMSIDIISYRFLRRVLTGVIVLSKNGPHREWVEDHLPEHIWRGIEYTAAVWGDNRPFKALANSATPKGAQLEILAANHEALRGKKFLAAIEHFVEKHTGSLLVLIDESHKIKNPSGVQHEAAVALGERASQRGIMTGTPIAKDLTDEWAQFFFLDKNIIGIEYKSTFRAQFCVMRGEGREAFVVGSKNVPQFNKLIAPYTFRATKADMNLPPKMPPDLITFELTDAQKAKQKELKENFLAQFEEGVVTVKNALTLIIRLQQLTSGFLIDDNEKLIEFEGNPRVRALTDFLETCPQQKRIIWARFRYDIELLKKTLGDTAVTYYGGDDDRTREYNKRAFLDPHSRITDIIANADSMGTGVDGLQHVCSRAIYYSQRDNLIERIQSEDRINRGGTSVTSWYNDVAANSSVDKKIIRNLKRKQSFSDMTLDDLKRIIDEL